MNRNPHRLIIAARSKLALILAESAQLCVDIACVAVDAAVGVSPHDCVSQHLSTATLAVDDAADLIGDAAGHARTHAERDALELAGEYAEREARGRSVAYDA
jgi:hypothetical protein